jgi:hypothetical protein
MLHREFDLPINYHKQQRIVIERKLKQMTIIINKHNCRCHPQELFVKCVF